MYDKRRCIVEGGREHGYDFTQVKPVLILTDSSLMPLLLVGASLLYILYITVRWASNL